MHRCFQQITPSKCHNVRWLTFSIISCIWRKLMIMYYIGVYKLLWYQQLLSKMTYLHQKYQLDRQFFLHTIQWKLGGQTNNRNCAKSCLCHAALLLSCCLAFVLLPCHCHTTQRESCCFTLVRLLGLSHAALPLSCCLTCHAALSLSAWPEPCCFTSSYCLASIRLPCLCCTAWPVSYCGHCTKATQMQLATSCLRS